jgi:hypothetical protein
MRNLYRPGQSLIKKVMCECATQIGSQLTLEQMIEPSDLSDSIKCRRNGWEKDIYVLVEVGQNIRFSFGFQGPDVITAEDKAASDWEIL